MFELRKTNGAYTNPKSSDFKTVVSGHRTQPAAMKALKQALKERAKRCGQGAWDCNYAVFYTMRRRSDSVAGSSSIENYFR